MNSPNILALFVFIFASMESEAKAAPGDLDAGFAPQPNENTSSVLTQPDGGMVLLGNFSSVAGASRKFLARLNPAGVVDAGFTASASGAGFSNPGVFCGAVQTDGKIVIGGLFSSVNNTTRNFLGRLNANGTLDTGYTASADNQVRGMVIQPDGKVVVAGYFAVVNGVVRNQVARLNVDGTLDTGFDPNAGDLTRTVALQADGKIIMGGRFTSVGGVTRNRAARVLANGTVDMSFDPNVNGEVYSVAVQPDGRILLGGAFTAVGGTPRNRIARVNADGTLDAGFNPGADGIVRSSTLQTDGRILIGGEFTTAGGMPRSRIARLNADGSLDAGFNSSANATVLGVTLQSDGRIVAGGEFSTAGGVTRNNLARFLNDPAVESLTATGPSRVEWLRSGASPEAQTVMLESSTNGGTTWSASVAGTRISGGWEFTGLSLTSGTQVRARARIAGGYNNGTAGLVESMASFVSLTPLQTWRKEHFNSPENLGAGADDSDPDNDGVQNITEYAFGLDPNLSDSATLPDWHRADDDYILTFTSPPGVAGVSYVAEQSTTLEPGSWAALASSTAPPVYTYDVPAFAKGRRFLRIRVTQP